jgi:hypothetical protein
MGGGSVGYGRFYGHGFRPGFYHGHHGFWGGRSPRYTAGSVGCYSGGSGCYYGGACDQQYDASVPVAGQPYLIPDEVSNCPPGTIIEYGGYYYVIGCDGTMTLYQ